MLKLFLDVHGRTVQAINQLIHQYDCQYSFNVSQTRSNHQWT